MVLPNDLRGVVSARIQAMVLFKPSSTKKSLLRWMSVRTDPNDPRIAAAIAWNGKLLPWRVTQARKSFLCEHWL